jgi:hypothetical protein
MSIKFKLAIVFLLLASRATAPEIKTLALIESNPVNIYDRLMRAVIQVESMGDTMAYNPLENAYGPFQIRPIRLIDYNQRTGKKYTMKDCFSINVSSEIFLYYARTIGSDYETIARRWNGSGEKTIEYWSKVKNELRNIR